MTKTIILIPVWGRVETFRKFVNNLNNYSDMFDSVFVFSKEDPHINELLEIYKTYTGIALPIQAPNHPVGRKMNAGINFIREAYEGEQYYMMNIGSDDIVDFKRLFEIYSEPMRIGVPFFGIDTCYFCDERGKNVHKIKTNKVIGACRMISSDFFNKNEEIYTWTRSRALDADSESKIGKKPLLIETDEMLCIDIKTSDNINPMSIMSQIAKKQNFKIDLNNPFK